MLNILHHSSDKGQLYIDFKYAPFSRDNRKSLNENDEKLIANNIKIALESCVCLHEFPNYQIDVFILVLQDDGSILSTAINAAGIAFVDASISCFDVLTSSTLAFVDGNLIVDPTANEEDYVNSKHTSKNHGVVTISSLNSMDQVSQIQFSGFIEQNLLKSAKKQLLDINKQHVEYFKKVMSMKIVRENRET
jgi:ribonuclease PH